MMVEKYYNDDLEKFKFFVEMVVRVYDLCIFCLVYVVRF